MDISQVIHMNDGAGETSYGNNSLLQRRAMCLAKPLMEEAMNALYSSGSSIGTVTRLAIADLGCSSGPNTLFAVTELMETVDTLCKKKGKTAPEYQIFLNDLPGNDFNTIFRSLLPNGINTRMSRQCFFAAVAGSFYGRLFPRNTLHFVHSNYSLQWLSQVPKGIEGNKRNIFMGSSSPQRVVDAYYKQFKDDFSTFLKCRAEELVPGGRMLLTLLGRQCEDPASSECCIIWQLLAMALNNMVTEGIIEEEKLNSFNIPNYMASPAEVEAEVLKESSFSIHYLKTSQVSWSGRTTNSNSGGKELEEEEEEGYSVAMCMRSVAEPLLRHHFAGDDDQDVIIEDVFNRYKLLIVDHMEKNKTKFINLLVSLVRTSQTSEEKQG